MKPLKLVIDRSKWLNKGDGNSQLRDRDGNMCALGFLSERLSVPNEVYTDQSTPGCYLAKEDNRKYAKRLGIFGMIECKNNKIDNSSLAYEIMETNDRHPDDQKEDRLKELFKKANIELSFINRKDSNP